MKHKKVNCWQHWRCGREPGGARVKELGPCPAATDELCDGINDGTNTGRFCWALRDTLCAGVMPEQRAQSCERCAFYRRVKYEEGIHFQPSTPGLGVVDPTDLHRLINNMVALFTLTRDVFASLAAGPLVTHVTELVCAVTASSSAATYLVDSTGNLALEAREGSVERPECVTANDESPVAEALRTRLMCSGTSTIPGRSVPASVLAMPIAGESGSVGVIELLKTDDPFSVDNRWFLREFGIITGLGISAATRVEDLRDLKRIDKAKSHFVALLMHQIGSPLATIASSIHALNKLGDKLKPQDRRKLIENSLERIDSIQTLSRRLLDLAAIRAGRTFTNIQPVCPADVLRKDVETQSPLAQQKGVEIETALHDAEAIVSADPEGLQVIFNNLLGNAIKYSVGPESKVAAQVTCAEGKVCVSFRDTGIGIPPEEQSRIFEEFHRASNVTGSHASGSGVGLAIVRELVDRYNGRIHLESTVGVGTTVTVEFPILADRGSGNESAD